MSEQTAFQISQQLYLIAEEFRKQNEILEGIKKELERMNNMEQNVNNSFQVHTNFKLPKRLAVNKVLAMFSAIGRKWVGF